MGWKPTGGGTDADAIHDNVSGEIAAVTEKTSLADDDVFIIEDSAASNVKKSFKASNLPSGGGGGTGQFVGVRATATSNQTFTNGVAAAVLWPSEDFDTNGFHDTGTNTSRITIPSGLGGKYLVGGMVRWTTSADDGRRYVHVRVNGSGTEQYGGDLVHSNASSSDEIVQRVSVILDLSAGDYIELFGRQDSGGDLDTDANDNPKMDFWAYQIGSSTWQDYTPTWASSGTTPSIGNGTLSGRYVQHGNTVHAQIELTIGSTTSLGTGTWNFTLPVTARTGAAKRTGTAFVNDSGSGFMTGICKPQSTTTISAIIVDPTDSDKYSPEVNPTTPISWATNDQLNMDITYEAA